MSAALQICYTPFDAAFLKLPPSVRARIEAKVDEIGLRLKTFSHHRLKGHNRYRLRVGDYRIIYTFDAEQMSFTCSVSAIARKSIVTSKPIAVKLACSHILRDYACTGNPNGPSLYPMLDLMRRIERLLSHLRN